ncbi:MAG: carbohydrate-binding protein [Gammaproteobacteria bacterium]
MRKRLIASILQDNPAKNLTWLELENLVEVEMTSEDAAYPIESALIPGEGPGWRAATPGKQTIRLLFEEPQRLQRIRLGFSETAVERTQEFVLRWSEDGGRSFREIVRQQWNFSPEGSNSEIEDYEVDLTGVTTLELTLIPDIGGRPKIASLAELRLA